MQEGHQTVSVTLGLSGFSAEVPHPRKTPNPDAGHHQGDYREWAWRRLEGWNCPLSWLQQLLHEAMPVLKFKALSTKREKTDFII